MPEDSTTRDSLRGEYAKVGKAELFDQLNSQITTEAQAGFYRQAADRLGMSEGALRVAVHRRDSRRQGEIHLDSPPAGRPLRHGPQVDAEWKGDPRRRISQRGIAALELRRRAGQGLAALPFPRDSGLPFARRIEDGDRDSRWVRQHLAGPARPGGFDARGRPFRHHRGTVPSSQLSRHTTAVGSHCTSMGTWMPHARRGGESERTTHPW